MTPHHQNRRCRQVLTMADTIAALETAYLQMASKEGVCRPRIDMRIPTSDPARLPFGTMEGGSTSGYFAIRMKSDVVFETTYDGSPRRRNIARARSVLRAGGCSPPSRPASRWLHQ